ncbi:NHL repeat-containing protein [Pedobacter africanus]|uniref:DNA-binding beta-propeller fold protein YncE n=1 Tax=Pedobacter africanus TaxID=151894 RepID=A0A1W2B4D6_9SPHI|nr:hypothetical protein [Pedobacter africanus]SMC67562.1 hypothetical protein SAMN04488524_1884 [Pedobacter africanus]
MKYLNKILPFLLLLLSMAACKKLTTDAFREHDIARAPLGITVINDDDQLPAQGVRVIISRKISPKGDFLKVDTIRTDRKGQASFDYPYPNIFKIEVDTAFYHKAEQVLEFIDSKGAQVVLHSSPKFGMGPLDIAVTDSKTAQPLSGISVSISRKASGQEVWGSAETENVDNAGKLLVSLPYPNEVRVAIADTMTYFPDTALVSLTSIKGAAAKLKTEMKPIAMEVNLYCAEYGAANKRAAFGTQVKISYRKRGETTFTDFLTDVIAANGKLKLNIQNAEEFRLAVTGDQIYADKTMNVTNPGTRLVSVDFPISLRAAKYPEPVLTNLQVGTLELNNELSVNKPQDIVTDKFGNRYITEGSGNRILRVDRFGNTTVLAGNGTAGTVDGAGASAQFNAPWGITIDASGNLYVTDNAASGGNKIRKITLNDTYVAAVSTIAGSGAASSLDGAGVAATFNRPAGICYDQARNCLYTVEWSGHRLRKIDLANNQVTTLAGSTSGMAAGVGTAAKFQIPWGVRMSADGNFVYVASWNGNGISKVRLSDNNVTILGMGKTNMSSPRGLYVSPANKVFIANTGGHYISKILAEADGNATTFEKLTGGTTAGYVDGTAAAARFAGPVGITYDPYTGIFYIADGDGVNQKIRTMKSADVP